MYGVRPCILHRISFSFLVAMQATFHRYILAQSGGVSCGKQTSDKTGVPERVLRFLRLTSTDPHGVGAADVEPA